MVYYNHQMSPLQTKILSRGYHRFYGILHQCNGCPMCHQGKSDKICETFVSALCLFKSPLNFFIISHLYIYLGLICKNKDLKVLYINKNTKINKRSILKKCRVKY